MSTIEELLEGRTGTPVYKIDNTAVGIGHADHVAPLYLQKLALTSPTSGELAVGIVISRTQATEFNFVIISRIINSYGGWWGHAVA
jgi:hypothetical protein